MKSKAILCTLISLSFTSGLVLAQGPGHQGGRGEQEQEQGHQQGNRGDKPNHRPAQRQAQREFQRQPQHQPRMSERQMEQGAGPQHAFHRGGRLPSYYHEPQYVVDDWRGHHLSAPPRGYHWVQTGDDFVLVAIATGIILQLMLNH